MRWLGMLFAWLGDVAHNYLGMTLFGSLVADGIIGGVGGVVSFLPNILILFLAIALMEDTGYMSRAAFIMDKVMHKLRLHGKSFIPMIIGFGCSVPAIMAARTLENRKDRIVTILVTPLMSCGARLPVYVLLAGAFFSPSVAGNVIFSLYIIGVLFAVLLARLFRSTLLKGDMTPFVMELPPYRMPTPRSLLLHVWERASMYLRKAGTTILAFTIIVWALMTFPLDFPNKAQMRAERGRRAAASENSIRLMPANPGSYKWIQLKKPVVEIDREIAAAHLENSFAGRIGTFLEPVMRPIGIDKKIGVALVSGLAAKEVIVSTLGTIYSIEGGGGSAAALKKTIRKDPNFTPLSAYVLMLFVLLSIPCVSTLAMIKRETHSWMWPAFSVAYHGVLAWGVCFIVYQGGRLLGL
jgi:ferrous iron transport protein B